MRKNTAIVCCLLILLLASVSCRKTEDGINGNDSQKTHIYSNLNAYFFASSYSDFLSAIGSRFTHNASQLDGDVVDVVVLAGNDLNYISDEQWTELRKVMLNGGALVLLSPTLYNLKDFSDDVLDDWDVFDDNFNIFEVVGGFEYLQNMWDDNSAYKNSHYDAIAMCANDIYILPDIDNGFDIDFVSLSVDMDTRDILGRDSMPDHENQYCDAEYYLDDIVDWINQKVQVTKRRFNDKSNGRKSDISNMGKEITIPLSFDYKTSMLGKQYTALKNNFVRHIRQKLIYHIWSVYNLENQRDYYLIHRDIIFEGSALKPVPTEPGSWLEDTEGKKRYYGPFMTEIKIETEFSDQNCMMTDLQPQNRMTQTTYTEGFSWSISSGLTITDKIGSSMGDGISVVSQQSTTVPDLETNVYFNSNKPKFVYAPHWPEKWPQGHFVGDKHDIAVNNIQCDLDLSQKWIYGVQPHDNAVYSITDYVSNRIDFLYSKSGFFKYIDEYRGIRYNWPSYVTSLPAPPRATQEWRMYCETNDPSLKSFLSRAYQKYYYDSPFKVAASTATDYKNINLFIKDFENHLKNDKALWKSEGFTGTYTFVWKLTNTSDVYKRYEFVVE